MLVLQRTRGETVVLDFSQMTDEQLLALRAAPPIEITVVEIRRNQEFGGIQLKARLGFTAPREVEVHRFEVFQEIQRDRARAKPKTTAGTTG